MAYAHRASATSSGTPGQTGARHPDRAGGRSDRSVTGSWAGLDDSEEEGLEDWLEISGLLPGVLAPSRAGVGSGVDLSLGVTGGRTVVPPWRFGSVRLWSLISRWVGRSAFCGAVGPF
ncbi:hypothetical protein GCM10010320_11190 [Streptomyces caelestis]|nr:hypothetical protein GCM10010320_11190 [Streptomyces caelestis]